MSPKKAKAQEPDEEESTESEEVEDDSDDDVDIEDIEVLEVDVEDEDIDEDIDEDEDSDDATDSEESEEEAQEEQPRRRQTPVQRSPMGKDEPPPPFAIGERVILTQNTRPRTGTPIGPYPVGSLGTVEAVLSLTAIVRFDEPPQTKEVVAFTCLKSAEKAEAGSKKKA